MDEYEIVRGSIEGKKKYCRIPIRSKTAEQMMAEGIAELSSEVILAMPHDLAARTIDAILDDWSYWLRRANELFVRWAGQEEVLLLERDHDPKSAPSAAQGPTTP